MLVKDRSISVSSNASRGSLTRSQTLPSSYAKGGALDPIPVSVPVLSGPNSISSSRSSFSSSSSLDQTNSGPVFDPVTLEEIHQTTPNGHHHHHDSLGQIDEYMNHLDTSGGESTIPSKMLYSLVPNRRGGVGITGVGGKFPKA